MCLQLSVPGLYGLPESVVSAALGVGSMARMAMSAQTLMSMAPKGTFIPMSDPACVAQCSAAMGPAVSSSSTAGR